MRYTLQCKECKRPGRTRFGQTTVNKTVAHTCECGGKIKPID